MQCDRMQNYLDAYLSNELDTTTSALVTQHLNGCADCAADLAARQRVRSSLRRAVNREDAPPALRQRILKQMRRGQ